ncbi:MAG: circularly permuted type 2 ATP-grasp protein, partial [Deinococcales bacterium]|nr:circularly permuted type 2 ATP-grasp protein [Chitinophagaceae bacterium]
MMTQTKQAYFSQLFLTTNYSYTELLGADGNLQPHWHTFFESLKSLGQTEIEDRSRDILRLLKENGVTYNIYNDPLGLNRPWNLDIIPFLISINEWQTIEPGLQQRATLLDLILKDIYGERQLIKNGLLPAELIYNHTGFLRQCVGIQQHSKHSLILYSADLARSADGNIWVLNDRTQAPSGYGYALENRTAMSRINPELFNGLKVRQLSSYFNDLQESLQEIAPYQKENPRIVILTPGPSNETYFEHSYLSSYMGFTLVQGDDLMVRDNYVWLKTIAGLEKVDVILRRVDDIYCDPLELKSDSQLGVPGLLQAIRSGNVSIANPLGSSVLENPGLMPFLQNINKHFFNTDLILPAIASWWCGQPKELQYVLNNIEKLVIKRIFRNTVAGSNSIDVVLLTKEKINQLKEAIKTHPHLYVGQEKVAFASSPSLVNGIMEPRNALFRSFLVSNKNNYTAMAGGLTRTSSRKDNMLISNQLGGISKDTWIISENKDSHTHHRKELFKTITPALIG